MGDEETSPPVPHENWREIVAGALEKGLITAEFFYKGVRYGIRLTQHLAAAAEPPVGTRATCKECGHVIMWVGRWEHVGAVQPRHPASPRV